MPDYPFRTLSYPIFGRYPEVEARTVWVPEQLFRQFSKQTDRWEQAFEIVQRELFPHEPVAWAEQVHSHGVALVASPGQSHSADGLVTDIPGMFLLIRTADCASVMIYDPEHRIVANLHAGWRGAQEGIIPRGISLMQRTFHSQPSRLLVAVSPTIRDCCYQVGPEFRNYFAEQYFVQRKGKIFLNLPRLLKHQLIESGVGEGNIQVVEHCTFCHPNEYPSYRRTGSANRMFHLIRMKKEVNL